MAIFSGDIFAENYTVSSSVTNVQISSVSGSTKSGDSADDIHQFTGSLHISASRITLTDGVGVNIGIGKNALLASNSGYQNIAIGNDTLRSGQGMYRNIAIGYGALYAQTSTSQELLLLVTPLNMTILIVVVLVLLHLVMRLCVTINLVVIIPR